MRKASIVLIVSIIILLFSSCAIKPYAYESSHKIYSMPQISSNALIYVDSETEVMYWYYNHESGGGLSVMLNSDGSPKLYNKNASKYNPIEINSNNLIYVDVETRVMYFYLELEHGSGLSVMLNPDGSPKLYNNQTSIYKVSELSFASLIYVDTETNVMYLYATNESGSGLSVMLNPDGSPKLYDRETSNFNVTEVTSNNWFYVDTDTNVMYWYSRRGGGGGFSLMFNQDGSPKIYHKKSSKYSITEIAYSNTFYVDAETNVVYCYSKHIGGGGLEPLVDETGKPKLAK